MDLLIKSHTKSILGIDQNIKCIDEAKKKSKNFKNLSFHKIKIEDFLHRNKKMFNLIICSHVVEHLNNYSLILKKLKHHGKKIYLEVPDLDSNDLNVVKKKLNISPIYTDEDHIYEFNRYDLLKLFKKLNFKIIDKEYKDGVLRFLVKT